MSEADKIPCVEIYQNVEIHDCQPRERIERIVKPEIDRVIDLQEGQALAEWCRDVARSPESRLLANAKVRALFEIATDERRVRPAIDLAEVRGSVAGLAVQRWRHPRHYCSLLDVWPPGGPAPVPREIPLEPKSYPIASSR